ncbi:uncharacterized protein LOC117228611 [Megalopta genalis]|uniref:uncharacterized protein LOC117228611 n=1 Tax=Megalopta genalis TaxID=115081 RepID=UPI0014433983|nr:uncharacterized protein LOC117228611 [Megalopta genalis]
MTSSSYLYCIILIALSECRMILAARTLASNEMMNNNVQSPVIMTHLPNVIQSMQENLENSDNRLCEIEYQVTRKTIGKCVKLGHGLNGCVSENYVNPFHQDCI